MNNSLINQPNGIRRYEHWVYIIIFRLKKRVLEGCRITTVSMATKENPDPSANLHITDFSKHGF